MDAALLVNCAFVGIALALLAQAALKVFVSLRVAHQRQDVLIWGVLAGLLCLMYNSFLPLFLVGLWALCWYAET